MFGGSPAKARKRLVVTSQENGRAGQGNVRGGVRVPSSGCVPESSRRAPWMDTLNSTVETDHPLLPPDQPTGLVKNDLREAVSARLGGVVLVGYTNVTIDAVLLPNLLHASPGVPLDGTVDPLPVPQTVYNRRPGWISPNLSVCTDESSFLGTGLPIHTSRPNLPFTALLCFFPHAHLLVDKELCSLLPSFLMLPREGGIVDEARRELVRLGKESEGFGGLDVL